MRESEHIFRDGLLKGLRNYDSNPTVTQSLVECHNLAPKELGLEKHRWVVHMNDMLDEDGNAVTLRALDYDNPTVATTRDITVYVQDYLTLADVSGVSVYIDDVLQGTTNASGFLNISDVAVGVHKIHFTKLGYDNTQGDSLVNDTLVVI